MALAPLHKCNHHGCNQLVRTPRCDKHAKEPKWSKRSKQSEAAQELYDYRWEQASKRYRQEHPLCAECERQGRVAAAECVDHIAPHRGDKSLFWLESNWQPLCDACHRSKTRRGE